MKSKTVRVYHFLSASNALDDLEHRRLKLSEIDKLNDPFELWCVAQSDRALRAALRRYKAQMSQQFGMLCFCQEWHNPVLWSHYADKHTGICLGFDVPSNMVKSVKYATRRSQLRRPLTTHVADELLYTKYRDWRYEREVRSWFELKERDPISGLYFYDFDKQIRLCEVLVGPLCTVTKARIQTALQGYEAQVQIVKSRLAFRTFQVVKNKRGFRKM
jgi:hypothetical protein